MTTRIVPATVAGWLAFGVCCAWAAVGWRDGGDYFWWDVTYSVAFTGLGALVLTFQPHNRAGWVLLSPVCVALSDALARYGETDGELPGAAWALWLANWIWMPGILLPITVLPFLIPNGQTPQGHWKRVYYVDLALVGLIFAVPPVVGVLEPGMEVSSVNNLLLMVIFLCAVAAVWNLVERFARSTGRERSQMAWILLGVLISLGWKFTEGLLQVMAGSYVPLAVSGDPLLVVGFAALLASPITWGIAILRHSLMKLNAVVHRLLVIVLLASILTMGYLLVVAVFGPSLVIQVATAVGLALVSPWLHSWLYGGMAKVVYGRRGTPEQAVAMLTRRLARAPSADDVLAAIADGVCDVPPAGSIEVALLSGDRVLRRIERGGAGGPVSDVVPLQFQGVDLGYIRTSSSRAMEPADRLLLDDLANAAAGAVAAAHRAAELQRARESLVIARERERRRIGRDLHDGLGPILSGLGFTLDALRDRVRDRPDAETVAAQAREQITEAGQLVRRVARELRPTAVDRLGLLPAIAELAANHTGGDLHVHVQSEIRDPALNPALEVAGYTIAAEAMTNAARHAHASDCWVTVETDSTTLTVVVEDNGTGCATPSPGVGLTSLRERAEELGGSLDVSARDHGGTRVTARLPIGDHDDPARPERMNQKAAAM